MGMWGDLLLRVEEAGYYPVSRMEFHNPPGGIDIPDLAALGTTEAIIIMGVAPVILALLCSISDRLTAFVIAMLAIGSLAIFGP